MPGQAHAPPRATAPRPSPTGRLPVPARRSVLVADDDAVSQSVAARMLERRGFRVDVAADGRQAVAMHASRDYDLIFMDCQMPELDGYAATVAIRQREADGPRTPIIALSADTAPQDRDRCRAVGMDDHVAKPVSIAVLDAAIARALLTP
jgi:CheY-like chemotaxis protein